MALSPTSCRHVMFARRERVRSQPRKIAPSTAAAWSRALRSSAKLAVQFKCRLARTQNFVARARRRAPVGLADTLLRLAVRTLPGRDRGAPTAILHVVDVAFGVTALFVSPSRYRPFFTHRRTEAGVVSSLSAISFTGTLLAWRRRASIIFFLRRVSACCNAAAVPHSSQKFDWPVFGRRLSLDLA